MNAYCLTLMVERATCPLCDGTGITKHNERCLVCDGSGKIELKD